MATELAAVRCPRCTWTEVSSYTSVDPDYVVDRYCHDHDPGPGPWREALAELDEIERQNGLRPEPIGEPSA